MSCALIIRPQCAMSTRSPAVAAADRPAGTSFATLFSFRLACSSSISRGTWSLRFAICETLMQIVLGKKQDWWKTDWNDVAAKWRYVYEHIEDYCAPEE